MIKLASVKCLLKRGKYGRNKAWKHNGLLGRDTVFSMVSNSLYKMCLLGLMVVVIINAFPPLSTFPYPPGF